MRPVNLIPPEKRRGDRAPSRTGALPYFLVAALALALVGVTYLTMTKNEINDRKADVASLQAREAEATARADALRPYAEFAAMSQARDATVTSLAKSRFDWERVLRELALVIPDDVVLTEVTGTIDPSVQVQGSSGVEGRDAVAGPALAMVGCGQSQRAVAGFLAALRDIDGVTRVGVASSERVQSSGDSSLGGSGQSADCRTRDPMPLFHVVVAFDAVPAPAVPGAAPAVPGTTPEATTSTASTSTAASGDPEAAAGTTAEQQQARDSAAEQTGEATNAANVLPGVAR